MSEQTAPGSPDSPTKRRGRPRLWTNEKDRRAAESAKRRARAALDRATRAARDDPAALRSAAINLRLETLKAPTDDLQVRDPDLLELAAEFPNTAEGLQYARDVLSGAIPACRAVRQACERHERDIERITDDAWQFTFNAQRSERVLRAVQMFREIRGPRAGKRFRFAPWQRFVIASAFGWVEKATGFRRFRYVFLAVPKGNGKSSLAATLGLYMLALDGEGGAEVYAAAVTRDQARIVFSLAQHMTRTDATFRGKYGISVQSHAVVQESTASLFRRCRAMPRH